MSKVGRIHWTAREKEELLARCQAILNSAPGTPMKEVVSRAQEEFPSARRRTPYPPLLSWVRAELRSRAAAAAVPRAEPEPSNGSPSDGAPATAMPEAMAGRGEIHANASPPGDEPVATSNEPPGAAAGRAGSFVEMGIAAGVEILVGILAHPRVREAVQDLLAAAPARAAAPPSAASEPLPIAARPGHAELPILIVGVTATQAVELERAYRGTIKLLFWTVEQSPDDLRELVGRAGMVIAIVSAISQAVDSSLSRMAANYVRHTSGLSGLRARLATLALAPERRADLQHVA